MTRQSMGRRELLNAAGAGVVGLGAITGRATAQSVADGPTVDIATSHGRVHATDLETGERRWTFESPEGSWDNGLTVVDGTLCGGGKRLYAADARTGVLEWSFDAMEYASSAPTVVNGAVYCSSSTGESS